MPFTVGDILDTKDSTYTILDVVHSGETEIYRAHRDHDNSDVILKMGDRTMDEALTLSAIVRDADPKLVPYLPKQLHLVSVDGESGLVFEPLDGFVSLAEVHDAYPDGIDPKDMAWMFRRLLVPLGFVARQGYAHCAVLPRHVMIEPELHGLVLIDWSHAGHKEDWVIPDRIPEFDKWYPADIDETDMDAMNLSAVDVYMAANLMSWLMGGDPERLVIPDVPRELRAFLTTCTKRDVRERPSDAHSVLGHFDNTIERLWGKKKFHPFVMPKEIK